MAFILAKQAFFNYYFASEVLLLAAMAGAGVALPEADVARPSAVAALTRGARRLFGNRTAAAADTDGDTHRREAHPATDQEGRAGCHPPSSATRPGDRRAARAPR